MNQMRARVGGLVLATLVVAAPIRAQTTGSIQGSVVSLIGESLPGVTITIVSSNLQGELQATSDESGRFRLLALPPGDYLLTAALDGFNPLEVNPVRVGLDRASALKLEMSTVFDEQITVTGNSPAIDRMGTTTGAEFPQELFSQLPTSRSFQNLAFLAPGTTDGGIEGNASIRGSSSVENRYVVEGLDVTDAAYGWLATELPMEFISELEVKTGAYGPEYGGALGGVLNVITKSGGNELIGDVFAYYNDADFQASSLSTLEFGTFEGFTKYDFGFDIGGRIIRDKLWYFVALKPQAQTENVRNRQDLPITVDRNGLAYAGKLSWAPNPSHRLAGSIFGDPIDQRDVYEFVGGSFNTLNSAGRILHDWDQEANNAVVRYSWTIDPRNLLEASLGRYSQDHLWAPTSEEEPWYIDVSGDGFWARLQACGDPSLVASGDVWFAGDCEGGVLRDELDRTRDQATVEYSHFFGSHEIQTGMVLRDVSSYWQIREAAPFGQPLIDEWGTLVKPEGTPGALFILLPAFQGVYIMSEDIGEVEAKTQERALYLQDKWRPTSSLTINLGLRVETVEADGGVPGLGLDFGAGEMLAPRLGATWDITGSGRARLYGHVGRFYESVPQILNLLGLGGAYINDYFFLYPQDGSLPS